MRFSAQISLVATFEEFLDALNEASPTRSAAGFAFEPVVKWFLETDPRYSSRLNKVWLWRDWPNRWGPDTGIDLVAEDADGKIWAIQSKQYDPEGGLLSKTHIDSFLSDSINELIDYRLLVTTNQGLGPKAAATVARQSRVCPISVLTYSDLVLAPVDWPNDPIRLNDGKARKPLKPRPHQRNALKDIDSLGNRGQLVMACGTGKTLTALWAAERLEAEKTLVLLPSLTLLSQTLTEWVANASEEFSYLPVCSDQTVSRGSDAAIMFTSDLQFPVTTNPDDIAAFMRSRGRIVLFSTYQSSPQIAAAQAIKGVPKFDLVIADEAHRCAGKTSSDFGTILDDEQIRATKKLFMTATPRTFSARVRKEADGNAIAIASMDDQQVFGPVLHQLNFGLAIEEELLTDYQVVVVAVDDERCRQLIDDRRLLKTDSGLEADAKTLASDVAVAKAIGEYKLERIITFHSRIKSAAGFARRLPEIASWMRESKRPSGKLVTNHVSGQMSTGERNKRLTRLRNLEKSEIGILSNAQCLSEGIDVPTLDGVAFIDPRRSQVDIIQAVGRAIRRSEGKSIGTVIIPVYLSNIDDAKEVLEASEFEPVWAVLRALRSHDETLGDAIDTLRYNIGRKGLGQIKLPTKIKFDLPEKVSSDFANSIRTQIVEQTSNSWHYWFGLFQRYVDRTGSARISTDHMEEVQGEQVKLGPWALKQRQSYSGAGDRRKLTELEISKLEELPGWEWNALDAKYQRNFLALQQATQRFGHARPPSTHIEEFEGEQIKVGQWINGRRNDYADGKLSIARIRALEALPGWVWNVREFEYQKGLEALRLFVEQNGHALVPEDYQKNDSGEFNLGMWVAGQRNAYRQERLPDQRRSELESVPGWAWNAVDAVFETNLELLHAFVKQHGHANVPQVDGGRNGRQNALGAWVSGRRIRYAKGQLTKEQIQKLEEVPHWEWDPREASYQRHLGALRHFAEREGHSSPGPDAEEHIDGHDLKLQHWVQSRRTDYRNGKLSNEEIVELESLPGWRWDVASESHDDHLRALKQFVEREGHALVPAVHKEKYDGKTFKIGSWIVVRRSIYKKGELDQDRINELEQFEGWAWSPLEQRRNRNLAALKWHVAEFGTSEIPQKFSMTFEGEKINLGSWVANEKKAIQEGLRDPDYITELTSLAGWQNRGTKRDLESFKRSNIEGYEVLLQFVEREGHASPATGHVERYEGQGFDLGQWVRRQRQQHTRSLAPSKVAQLEALPGWQWSPKAAQKAKMLRALRQYGVRENHFLVPFTHQESFEGELVKLGVWVRTRRNRYRASKMAADEIIELENMPGWAWDPDLARFYIKLSALKQFHKREGHLKPPRNHREELNGQKFDLYSWVTWLQGLNKKGKLDEDRHKALNALPGWTWTT